MNAQGGMADAATSREAAFGGEYVTRKRLEYVARMLQGAAVSGLATAALLVALPPRGGSAVAAAGLTAGFAVRATAYLLAQTALFTIGGMWNNPTLK